MERYNSTLMNRIQLLKVFFFSNQSKVYVVMKQEIETKSWVKQICAIINHKIETKWTTTRLLTWQKITRNKPSDIFIKRKR